MLKEDEKMKYTFNIKTSLVEELQRIKEKTGVTLSFQIEKAIERWLEENHVD